MIEPTLYDQARDRIAADGFTPDTQSRIALVVCATKNANLLFQSQAQWLPNLGVVQQFFISQAARELEAVTLLLRTTQWSTNAMLALEAQRIVAPLLAAWGKVMQFPGPLFNPPAVYRGISLGHAQLARIRLIPIIPEQIDPLNPFALVLHRIEQENGRMLQTQIRLLKSMGSEMPLAQREALVEQDQEVVDAVFNDLLTWLSAAP
ncbi:hypothetical protein AT959_02975 [Dechloromonas denitrificans]|uniref:Uncharacterized protein n=1 Tax=Dechloromonas denitrificans TaxID=281362 RepID=A0A133XM77_9RHOO|nr:hypothetical protein [Dechloromonas denitrificans]KXB32041.1 hypothetical protein AT959_02975 [Dechloromonas denitrificans]